MNALGPKLIINSICDICKKKNIYTQIGDNEQKSASTVCEQVQDKLLHWNRCEK